MRGQRLANNRHYSLRPNGSYLRWSGSLQLIAWAKTRRELGESSVSVKWRPVPRRSVCDPVICKFQPTKPVLNTTSRLPSGFTIQDDSGKSH
jgi:hypothetical protein